VPSICGNHHGADRFNGDWLAEPSIETRVVFEIVNVLNLQMTIDDFH